MRIISGKWRGQKLADIGQGDAAAHLRPSSDRARETLFNMLSHPRYENIIQGANVLDIFAGTGALSLEALSRGASSATLVDNGTIAQKLIRESIKKLDANATLMQMNALKPTRATQTHDLIFLDPPYNKSLGEQAIKAFIEMGWIADGSVIVWEDEAAVIPHPSLRTLDRRSVGRAQINFFRYDGTRRQTT